MIKTQITKLRPRDLNDRSEDPDDPGEGWELIKMEAVGFRETPYGNEISEMLWVWRKEGEEE